MITGNPFADLFPAYVMQIYVVVMVLLVIGGTVLDMIHKKSAKYFFENSEKAKAAARRNVSSGEKMGLAVKTLTNEVLTSSEFANPKRRMSHLLTMYGFIIFVVTSAILIFAYPTSETAAPAALPILWHVGALMLCIGGYWFWFAIRVDVSAEGYPWYRVCTADMFILSLLATCTFALIWSATRGTDIGWLFFGLFIISSLVLFGGVLWSKFAHMFFKPAAAYQKKVTRADGSQENLPDLPELDDAATQSRYPDIPEYMGTKPPNMGLGIKREEPSHF